MGVVVLMQVPDGVPGQDQPGRQPGYHRRRSIRPLVFAHANPFMRQSPRVAAHTCCDGCAVRALWHANPSARGLVSACALLLPVTSPFCFEVLSGGVSVGHRWMASGWMRIRWYNNEALSVLLLLVAIL